MIKSITVTNYLGDSIKLELARPEESGFIVTSVTGLGAGKANINMTEVATNNGGLFNSSRLPSRNIVISLKFMFKETIEDMRQLSYKYFPIKKKLTLLVETDNRLAEIDGYVETNEPDIFSKEEGSDISIVCPNPFFYSAGEDGKNTTIFFGVEPMFEFPFSKSAFWKWVQSKTRQKRLWSTTEMQRLVLQLPFTQSAKRVTSQFIILELVKLCGLTQTSWRLTQVLAL